MAHKVRIDWSAPCLMFGSFFSGLLFALIHHLYYNALRNNQVSTKEYRLIGSNLSRQQLDTVIGTAFAFAVKAAFSLSVSAAYYQAFWSIVRRSHSTKRPPDLRSLDAAWSAIGNALAIFHAPLWFRYPLLFLIAVTAWLLPIPSIITPGTLSIRLVPNVSSVTMQNVPTIDFLNLNYHSAFSSVNGSLDSSLLYSYSGSSSPLKKVALGAAVQNAILPITPLSPESSWELEFSGPSLRCEQLSASQRLAFEQNVARYLQQPLRGDELNCVSPPGYLAWVPGYRSAVDPAYRGPFVSNGPGSLQFNASLQYTPNATLYVMVFPNMLAMEGMGHDGRCNSNYSSSQERPLGDAGNDITMLQCDLYNSTYHTCFTYSKGVQTLNTKMVRPESDTRVTRVNLVRGPGVSGAGANASCATLNTREVTTALNKSLAIGSKDDLCNFDLNVLSQLSYQSIFNAFAFFLAGNITLDSSMNGAENTGEAWATNIANTKELKFLTHSWVRENSTYARHAPSLQEALLNSSMSNIVGSPTAVPASPLKETLETLFRNITLSLMSTPSFQADNTSLIAPPKAQVTTFTSQTIYLYSADKLWLAYGLATAFTSLALLIGVAAMFANGASYSNSFSTVLRTALKAEISADIRDDDIDGSDPLPKYLARATVRLPDERQQRHGAMYLTVTNKPSVRVQFVRLDQQD